MTSRRVLLLYVRPRDAIPVTDPHRQSYRKTSIFECATYPRVCPHFHGRILVLFSCTVDFSLTKSNSSSLCGSLCVTILLWETSVRRRVDPRRALHLLIERPTEQILFYTDTCPRICRAYLRVPIIPWDAGLLEHDAIAKRRLSCRDFCLHLQITQI